MIVIVYCQLEPILLGNVFPLSQSSAQVGHKQKYKDEPTLTSRLGPGVILGPVVFEREAGA